MQTIRPSTLSDIESFLTRLGGKNQEDNIRSLAGHASYFLAEFTEPEFMRFVFLQTNEVLAIAPREADRGLASVAARALQLGPQVLSPNWDLADVQAKTLRAINEPLRPLVIRTAHRSERTYGQWYVQDGSHTALGYAMLLLGHHLRYKPILAYCASADA